MLSNLDVRLPDMASPIDQLADQLAHCFVRCRLQDLDPLVLEADVQSWVVALGTELQSRSHSSPDKTAYYAVYAAIHLHRMPMDLGLTSLFARVTRELPKTTWQHLTRLIPSTLQLKHQPPQAYPFDDCPLIVGLDEWDRRQTERQRHHASEYYRLVAYAKQNEVLVMRWLALADENDLTAKQLEFELANQTS